MEMNNKETKSKKDRLSSTPESSLSIIRTFLRYAASTIVYHKLSHKNKEESKHQSKEVMGINDDSENSSLKNIECMSEDQLKRCFINKTFCGLDNLKFMDAVDEYDSIKDDNVFKITKWLEVKVFPFLEKNVLQSVNLLVLSTPIYKSKQYGVASLDIFKFQFQPLLSSKQSNDSTITTSTTSAMKTETTRQSMKRISQEIKTALSTLMDVLSQSKSESNDDSSRSRHSGNEKQQHKHQRRQKNCRFQVSMNFILEYRDYGHGDDGNGSNSYDSNSNRRQNHESTQKTTSSTGKNDNIHSSRNGNESLFSINDNNPLQEMMMELSTKKKKIKDEETQTFHSQNNEQQQDYEGHKKEGTKEMKLSLLSLLEEETYRSKNNFHIFTQYSHQFYNDEEEEQSIVSSYSQLGSKRKTLRTNKAIDNSSFQFLHKVQSSHHSVLLFHKKLSVDKVSSFESLRRLFGHLPSIYDDGEKGERGDEDEGEKVLFHNANNLSCSNEKLSFVHEKKRRQKLYPSTTRIIEPRKCFGRKDLNIEKIQAPPPTLTPMRRRDYFSPTHLTSASSKDITKRINTSKKNNSTNEGETSGFGPSLPPDSSSPLDKQSFITPRKSAKRKSPCVSSSEAPTIIVRLSSCMTTSHSPLYSSVTPPNNT